MENIQRFKSLFINKYNIIGDKAFYNYLLSYCSKKIVLIEKDEYKGILPHLEMLECYEKSLILFRRDGDQSLFNLAKIFRKVAHKIYRIMMVRSIVSYNNNFLTDVSRVS